MRDGSYAESEAYDSASFVPIHTRSELSSDSYSAFDSASVASVNQPLWLNMLDFPLMVHVWMKLPVIQRIHPQSNKFATGKENKASGDSRLNDSPV